jgi:Protein of unknown function (DUF664)
MPSLPVTFAEDVVNQPARAQFEAFLDEHRGLAQHCGHADILREQILNG